MGKKGSLRRKEKRERQRQQRRAEEALKRKQILVHTIFGQSIVSPASSVYVRLGEEYVRKPAEELKRGEDVLFAKEGATLTLEQVEDALMKSQRYAAAAPVLFFHQGDGTYTTRFNHVLREGIAGQPLAWPEALRGMSRDSAISMETTSAEAACAARHVHDTLSRAGVDVSEKHIRYRWFGGEVIAPRAREEVFRALLPLSGGLSALLGDDFAKAYETYTKIRRTVMHSVSKMLRGSNGQARERKEPLTEQMDIRPEIRLVAEHFATDVSTNYAAANVLRVEQIEPRDAQERGRGVLFKGIHTQGPEDPGILIKDMRSFAREVMELTPLVDRLFYEFLMRKYPAAQEDRTIFFGDTHIGIGDIRVQPYIHLKTQVLWRLGGEKKVQAIYGAFINALKETDNHQVAQKVEKLTELIKHPLPAMVEMTDLFLEEMYSGEIDSYYGFDMGSICHLIDYSLKATLAVPDAAGEIEVLAVSRNIKRMLSKTLHINVSTGKEEQRLREVLAQLRKQGYLVPYKLSAIAWIVSKSVTSNRFGPLIFSGKRSPNDALREVDQVHKRHHKSGINHDYQYRNILEAIDGDDEAIEVLRRMGFGHLEPLFTRADQKESMQKPNSPPAPSPSLDRARLQIPAPIRDWQSYTPDDWPSPHTLLASQSRMDFPMELIVDKAGFKGAILQILAGAWKSPISVRWKPLAYD